MEQRQLLAVGDITILTEMTAAESIAQGTSLTHNFDTIDTNTGSAVSYTANSTDVQLNDAGHYLVLYNSRFDSTGGSNRSEFNSHLNLGGSDLPIGWSQGYFRRLANANEAFTSGGAIINSAGGGQVLQLQTDRTDNNGAAARRQPNATGLQLLKLRDDLDYLRLSQSSNIGSTPASTAFVDVTYNTQDETSAGFSHSPGSGNITLVDGGKYLVFANTHFTGGVDRGGYLQRLTLDNVEINGSKTSVYRRGLNSTDDGAAAIGTIISASAGQVLSVEVAKDESNNQTPTISGGKTALTIVELPPSADIIRIEDSTAQDFNEVVDLSWDTNLEVGSSFAHSETVNNSQVAVTADGNYLFFASLYDDDDSNNDRQVYNQRWKVNDGTPEIYGQTGRYSRDDGAPGPNDGGGDQHANGNWSGIILPGLTAGDYVEATSRGMAAAGILSADTNGLQALNIGSIGPQPPVINDLDGDAFLHDPGMGPDVIDQGTLATITDADNPANYDGGNLTVTITMGLDGTEDELHVQNSGMLTFDGTNASWGGTVFGTVNGMNDGKSGNPLILDLDADAIPAAVDALLQNVTYENTDGVMPDPTARQITFSFADGTGQSSNTPIASVLINAGDGTNTVFIWDGNTDADGDGTSWSDPNNWDLDGTGLTPFPDPDDTAIFRNNVSGTVDLGGTTRVVDTLRFDGTASFTFDLGTISPGTLDQQAGAGTNVFDALVLGAGMSANVDGGILVLNNLANSISDTSNFAVTTELQVTVDGNQTALGSGQVSLNNGELDLIYGGTTPAITSGADISGVSGTSTLSLDAALTTVELDELTMDGGELIIGGTATQQVTFSGQTTINAGTNTVTTNSDLVLNGVTGAGALTKQGSETLFLNNGVATNDYAGVTTVSVGDVVVGADGALGAVGGNTVVSSGAQLVLAGLNYTTAEPLSLGGNGGGTGALRTTGTSSYAGAISLANPAEIQADSGTLALSGGINNASNNLTIETVGNVVVSTAGITGGGDVIKEGDANLTLNVASTYGGATTINNGRVIVQNNDALGDTVGNTTVNNGGTLRFDGGITLPAGETVSIRGNGESNEGALRNQAGTNAVTGQILFGAGGSARITANGGTLNLSGGMNLTEDLDIHGNGTVNVTGQIIGAAAADDIDKNDNGTLILANATNSFAGPLDVNNGIVRVSANGALGATSGPTTVASGATLEFVAVTYSDAEPISFVGSGEGGIGALSNNSGDSTIDSAVVLTMTGDATIYNADATSVFTIEPDVELGSALTFDGPGDTVMNGDISSFDMTGVTATANYDTTVNGIGSLEAYWKFNEGSGTTIFDETANNHDGTLSGAVGLPEFTLRGRTGETTDPSLDFDDAGNAKTNGHHVDLAFTYPATANFLPEVTVSTWFKTDAAIGGNTDDWALIDFDRSDFYNLAVRPNDGGIEFATAASGSGIDDMNTTTHAVGAAVNGLNDGEWHHVVATYDNAGTKRIYVDGTLAAEKTGAHGGAGLGIGNARTGVLGDGSEGGIPDPARNNLYYDGEIDDMAVYHATATATDVKNLYVSGGTQFQAVSVVKNGTGQLTLGGTNDYLGFTNVNNGVVIATNNSSLGSVSDDTGAEITAGTVVADGATLAIQGTGLNLGESISITGDGGPIDTDGNSGNGDEISPGIGALVNISGTNEISAAIIIAETDGGIGSDAGTLTISGGLDLALGNVNFDGPGDIHIDSVVGGYGLGVPFATEANNYAPDGFYQFEEGPHSTVFDGSVNDRDGTRVGAVHAASPAFFEGGYAMQFDGNNDYVTLGDVDLLEGSEFTVAMWFNRLVGTTGTGNDSSHLVNNVLVSQASAAANDNFELGTEGDLIEIYMDSSLGLDGLATVDVSALGGISDGDWHHIALTYDTADATELKVYFDGQLAGQTGDFSGALDPSNTSPLGLGLGRPGSTNNGDFNGLMDDVGFFPSALTLAEIQALMGGTPDNAMAKAGAGDVTLTGDNTYDGPTTVTAGKLVASSDTALGATSNGTVVADGATLQLDNTLIAGTDVSGFVEIPAGEDLQLGSSTSSNPGTLENVAGSNTYGGNISAEVAETGEIEILSSSVGELLTVTGGVALGQSSLNVDGSGNTTITGAISSTDVVAIGEIGQVSNLDGTPQTISFSNSYTNPVIVALPEQNDTTSNPLNNDPDTVEVRVSNVNLLTGNFDIELISPPSGSPGFPMQETVNYIVLEAGEYTLDTGDVLKAGTVSVPGNADQTITFSGPAFSATPVAVTTLMSENSNTFVKPRHRGGINTSGFDVFLEEAAGMSQHASSETVSFIAIQPTSGMTGGIVFEAGNTPDLVTHDEFSVSFSNTYTSPPIFVGDMQTLDGGDPSSIRFRYDGVGVNVFTDEDLNDGDGETAHTTEAVGFLAFASTGNLGYTLAPTVSLTKEGSGALTLTADNTYEHGTTVMGGALFVNNPGPGSGTGSSDVSVSNLATFAGSGTVAGVVTAESGSFVSPGAIATSTADLGTGDLNLDTGSTFTAELNGTSPGTDYDQLDVTGMVDLDADSGGGATLSASRLTSFVPANSDTFTIVDNDLTGPGDSVLGTFNGLGEGATVTLSGIPFTISYVGDDGNNVVLSTVTPTTVYVDDSWVGTSPGTTPATSEPAGLIFGYNAFDVIQDGIDRVATNGTVVVYGGSGASYSSAVNVNKTLTSITTRTNTNIPAETVVNINGAVTLDESTTIATDTADVTFGSTVNAVGGNETLAVNGNDVLRFSGLVGNTSPLGGLSTDAGGTTQINTSSIAAQGAGIAFNNGVVLMANTSLADSGGTGIFFDTTIEGDGLGPWDLSITTTNAAAEIEFGGAVGSSNALDVVTLTNAGLLDIQAAADFNLEGSFTQNGAGVVDLAGDVTTTADDISIATAVTLRANVSLTTGAGIGDITFAGTVNDDGATSNRDLLLTAGMGSVDLQSDVGGATPLEMFTVASATQADLADVSVELTISVTGTNIDLNGNTYSSTDDAITFTGAVDLDAASAAITVTSGGAAGDDITFTGTIEDPGSNNELYLVAGSGNVELQSNAGGTNALSRFEVTSAVQADLANVAATGAHFVTATNIDLNGTSYLSADGTMVYNGAVDLESAGLVTFDSDTNDDGVDGGVQITGTVSDPGSNSSLTIDADDGQVDIANIAVNGALSVTGGNIDLNGTSYSSNDGAIAFFSPVDLIGAGISIDSDANSDATDGNISFSSTIDGNQTLALDADTGTVSLNGNVGDATAISSLTVSAASQADLAGITTNGNTDVTATNIDLNGTAYTSNNSSILLTGNVDLDSSGVLAITSGMGTNDDITVTGVMNDTGSNSDLELIAGSGNVDLQSNAGGTGPLNRFEVTSAMQADLANVATTGAHFVTATNIDLNGTSYQSEDGTMVYVGPVDLESSGLVTFDSDSNNDGNDGGVQITGTISDPGSNSSLTMDADAAGQVDIANITINGAVSITGGNIDLNGTLYSSATSDVTLNDPVDLHASPSVSATNITFQSTIDEGTGATSSNLTTSATGLTQFNGNVGSATPLDSLDVTTGGPFNLAVNVTTVNNVDITVTDTAAVGDSLTISSGTTQSSAGNIVLTGGDSVGLQAASAITASSAGATLTVNVDPSAGDPDTTGGTIDVDATVTTDSGAFLVGGDDNDTFNLAPQSTTTFDIDGNPPVFGDAGVPPGDTLNLDVSGTTSPTLTLGGTPGSGTWTFDPPHQQVTYTSIETVDTTGDYDLILDMAAAGFQDGSGDTVEMELVSGQTLLEIRVNGNVIFQGNDDRVNSFTLIGSTDDDSYSIIADSTGALPNEGGGFAGAGTLPTPRKPLSTAFLASGLAPSMPNPPVIYYDGGAGTDSLTIDLSASPVARDAAHFSDDNGSFSANRGDVNVASGGGPLTGMTMTFSDVAPVRFDGVGGTLLVDATSTPATTTLTVADSGTGTDGENQITGDGALSATTFVGFDTLTLRGGGGGAGEAITLQSADGSAPGGSGAALTTINLDGDDTTGSDANVDELNVQSFPATITVNVFGGDGSDVVNVSSDAPTNAGNLDGILGTLNVNGENHDAGSTALMIKSDTKSLDTGDILHVSDAGTAAGSTYVVTGTTVQRTNVATGVINYATTETLNVTAGSGNDDIDVTSTAAINTTVNGSAGVDDIDITTTAAASNLFVNGDAGADVMDLLGTGDGAFVQINGNFDSDTITQQGNGANSRVQLNGDQPQSGGSGANGNDIINVQASATGSLTDLFGGLNSDLDTFNLGNTSNSLDDLLGDICVDGGGNLAAPVSTLTIKGVDNSLAVGDTLNINDQGDTDNNFYNTSFTRGSLSVSFTGIETYTINAGSGNNTLSSTSLPGGMNFTYNGGAMVDTVTLNVPTGNVVLNGAAGNDVMNVAAASLAAGSFTIANGEDGDDTIIQHAGTTFADATTRVELNGDGGADTLEVRASNQLNVTNMQGGANNDIIRVGHNPTGLNNVLGEVCVEGDAHDATPVVTQTIKTSTNTLDFGDSLVFNDFNDVDNNVYNLSATTFQRTAAGTPTGVVTYGTVERVVLNTGSAGGHDINVTSTAAAVNTTINGGTDANDIDVTTTGDSSNVVINTGAAADDINIANTGMGTFLIATSAGSADIITQQNSGTNSRTQYNAEDGTDTIHIQASGSGSVADVVAGSNTDTINIGSAANSLDGLLGDVCVEGDSHDAGTTPLTIKGDTNTLDSGDMLNVNDQGDGSSNTYSLSDTQFARSGTGTVTYGTVETLDINTGSGANTVNVSDTTDSVNTTINGGSDTDDINVTLTGDSSNVIINGGGSADDVDTTTTGSGSYVQLNGNAGNDNIQVDANGAGSSHTELNGNDDSDTLAIISAQAGTVVNISGNAGNDTINVASATSSLDGILSTICVHGDAGTDTLTVDDSADSSSNSYDVDGNSVDRGTDAANEVEYDTVESLLLNAGTGDDTFTIFIDNDADGNLANATFVGNAGSDEFNPPTPPAGSGNPNPNTNPRGKVEPSNVTELTFHGGAVASGNPTSPADGDTDIFNLDMTTAPDPVVVDATGGVARSLAPSNTLQDIFFSGMETICYDDKSGDDLPVVIGDLYVRTTANEDRLVFSDGGSGTVRIQLRVDNVRQDMGGPYAVTNSIIAYGQDENDTIIFAGNLARNTISYGEQGDDNLQGSVLSDQMFGGDGNDTLLGGEGTDTLNGEAGQDRIVAGAGNDILNGGTENDELQGEDGDDVLDGGAGDDDMSGGNGNDLLRGQAGLDSLSGQWGDDILIGGDDRDVIFGNQGRDLMIGGGGIDDVNGDIGDDIIVGDSTSYDNDDTSLLSIMSEWRATGPDFATRVSTITTGPGPNLTTSNILADSAIDNLIGKTGPDLIFQRVGEDIVFAPTADDDIMFVM